ncbi:(d)CMP kinase [Mariniblastus sp.]|nr:(d)CMP kinase [Mariniblastus sp.]MDB4555452.1 (d)CMP kinase [bacterium]MDC3223442.1 (d)CMP kinase [Mariniblastus sp.]
MIVAIDGPAGAGKSSVTRLLAERLGFQFLDTGAMYRAVTLAAIDQGIDLLNESALQTIATEIEIIFEGEEVFIDGKISTSAIREPEVTRSVASVANAPSVRSYLVDLQRRIASQGNFVCEGRDQGTVAFPDSFCKIFLTASPKARAQRRVEQLSLSGKPVEFEVVIRDQEIRDQQDSTRDVGRLMKAQDAIELLTDDLSLEEVVAELESIVRQRIEDKTAPASTDIK